MEILIDGYNLILTCGLAGRQRTAVALKHGRERLLREIAERLGELERQQITIVYDASRLPPGEQADSRQQGIRILFAIDHDDADSLIEQLIQQHSVPRKLLVVSSDHRIQRAAKRRKAVTIDSDLWLDRLEELDQRGRPGEPVRNQSANAGPEVDWHQEFAGLEFELENEGLESKRPKASPLKEDEPLLDDPQEWDDTDWMAEFGFDRPEDESSS